MKKMAYARKGTSNYWIFKVNPDKYDIEGRLADVEPCTTWRVNRYRDEVKPGHIAFIWKTGPKRGIRAKVEIESLPRLIPETEIERNYWKLPVISEIRVDARFLERDLNIPAEKLRSTAGLENLSVFRLPPRGTVFPVTEKEGGILLKLIKPNP